MSEEENENGGTAEDFYYLGSLTWSIINWWREQAGPDGDVFDKESDWHWCSVADKDKIGELINKIGASISYEYSDEEELNKYAEKLIKLCFEGEDGKEGVTFGRLLHFGQDCKIETYYMGKPE